MFLLLALLFSLVYISVAAEDAPLVLTIDGSPVSEVRLAMSTIIDVSVDTLGTALALLLPTPEDVAGGVRRRFAVADGDGETPLRGSGLCVAVFVGTTARRGLAGCLGDSSACSSAEGQDVVCACTLFITLMICFGAMVQPMRKPVIA